MTTTPRPFLTCLLTVCLLMWAGPVAAQSEWIDSPMYRDPDLPFLPPVVYVLPEATWRLWQKALERPEVDLRCKAADAIALAHRLGFKGLEATIPNLVAASKREQPPVVRLAIARALIALDAKQAASDLWERAATGGIDLREAVEPALARWDHVPTRTAWLERLGDPATQPRNLVLAMRGLAAVRETRAVDGLRKRVMSNQTIAPVRLEAALALSLIRTEGLENDAKTLSADASPRGIPARLAGVSLLRHHQGKAAIELLQTMAKDKDPSVAALAVARLIAIDPKLASGVRDSLLANRDPVLRAQATEILLKVVTADSLSLLTRQLDDPHSTVRGKARLALNERAVKGGQRKQVIENVTTALASKQWRAQQQAAMLLTDLGHKPAAARMVELLRADRPEVFVTVACGLRRLAEPTSLPGALAYLEEEYKRFSVGKQLPGRESVIPIMEDHQLSQLLQLMGKQKYIRAEAVMRSLVPRNGAIMTSEARTAAVWALGILHEVKSVADLTGALEKRLADLTGALEERLNDMALPPESTAVRQMCVITLGRLKAKGSLPILEKFAPQYEITEDLMSNAGIWAIQQITGKPLPVSKPRKAIITRNWFLVANE